MAEIQKGYVRVFRSITEWEWYQDGNTRDVFLHLLFTANYKPGKWQGHQIERGQRAVSYRKLASELNLSVQCVRTAVNHLKSTGELTCEKIPECLLFTVTNYHKFQEPTQDSTRTKHTANTRLTRDQHLSNNSNKSNNIIPPYPPAGDAPLRSSSDVDIEGRFEKFWAAYPRQVARTKAERAFARLNPDDELLSRMLEALARQKELPGWREEGGRYVPYPSTWLRERRWEELPEETEAAAPYSGYRRLTADD